MFIDRRRRRRDKYLQWKTGLLVAGIALILLGDRLAMPALVWAAVAVLGVGFVLRFLPHKETRTDERHR